MVILTAPAMNCLLIIPEEVENDRQNVHQYVHQYVLYPLEFDLLQACGQIDEHEAKQVTECEININQDDDHDASQVFELILLQVIKQLR